MEMKKAFRTMLENWNRMKGSSEEEAEEHADQFQRSFYVFVDEMRSWFGQLPEKPKSLEEAKQLTELRELMERLPAELELNFETELELIVEGQTREEDARYD